MSLPQEIQLKKMSNRIGWLLILMFGLMLISAFLMDGINALLLQTASERVRISVTSVTESILYMIIFVIPVVLFYTLPRKISCQRISFSPRLIPNFPLILLAFVGINLSLSTVNHIFCQWVGVVEQEERQIAIMQNPEMIALYMTTVLAPAFAEELLFRGVIYTNLRPWGKHIAIGGSAVLFGMMHMNTAQFFYTVSAGILLAVLYEMTGSVWSGILIHLCNNFYSVFQAAISARLSSILGAAVLYLLQALLIFCGVISIIALGSCYKKQIQQKRELLHSVPQGIFQNHPTKKDWQNNTDLPWSRSLYLIFTTPGMMIFSIIAVTYVLL